MDGELKEAAECTAIGVTTAGAAVGGCYAGAQVGAAIASTAAPALVVAATPILPLVGVLAGLYGAAKLFECCFDDPDPNND